MRRGKTAVLGHLDLPRVGDQQYAVVGSRKSLAPTSLKADFRIPIPPALAFHSAGVAWLVGELRA